MGGKKIECYFDCVSPYSFFAFSYLRQNAVVLAQWGVEVDFIPVFLGGINVGSGNKPPFTLEAKARYSPYDMKRAQKFFGKSFETPAFFPILSLRPQRTLVFVKQAYPKALYDAFWNSCFEAMWVDHLDISKPQHLQAAVGKVFSQQAEVEKIMASADDPGVKQTLSLNTEHAFKDLGAFGAPWFWVHDGKGAQEPFFGSDRFHYMWEFLDLPHRGFELLLEDEGPRRVSRL